MLQWMAHAGDAPRALAGDDVGPSDRTCPACGAAMRRVAAYGAVLDSCADHGVWFDRSELERVLYRFAIGEPTR